MKGIAATALALGCIMATSAWAALKPGDAAPVFTAQAALDGKEFTFSMADALKKGPVVLYFFPKAFTTGCTAEAHEFAEAAEQFKALGATLIGMSGDDIGTLFLGEGDGVSAWKRWIGYTMPPKGKFVLDQGARRAVEQQGKSLLAAGIVRVEGEFPKGEVVSLVDVETGEEFARGLSNYDSIAARTIAGQRKDEITRTIGSVPYDEVIHRDNLVVTSLTKS